jgi:N-acetyl-beta-hexosaminidase
MAEIPDFWSSLDFDDDVPEKFRKFLHHDKSPATWAQTTAYYAHAYSYAFERLIMIAIDMWPQAEYLRMPAFFLARHSAELHLKEVIKQFSAANGQDYDAADIHSLVTLWNKANAQLRLAGWPTQDEDTFSKYCGQLIQHMHDNDPSGQRFRYPEDNAGKLFDTTLVEFQELAKAHASITLWCG